MNRNNNMFIPNPSLFLFFVIFTKKQEILVNNELGNIKIKITKKKGSKIGQKQERYVKNNKKSTRST